MFTFDPARPPNCPPYPFVTTLTSCTSFCPSVRFVAPELFRFRYGSLESIPLTVKRLLVADTPFAEKFPNPPAVFSVVPGVSNAEYVMSFPGFGTFCTVFSEIVVDTLASDACSSGACSVTVTTCEVDPIESCTSTVLVAPSAASTVRTWPSKSFASTFNS